MLTHTRGEKFVFPACPLMPGGVCYTQKVTSGCPCSCPHLLTLWDHSSTHYTWRSYHPRLYSLPAFHCKSLLIIQQQRSNGTTNYYLQHIPHWNQFSDDYKLQFNPDKSDPRSDHVRYHRCPKVSHQCWLVTYTAADMVDDPMVSQQCWCCVWPILL